MFWKCPDCGRNAANAVNKCRKCGRDKPICGILEDNKPIGTPRATPLKSLEEQGKVSQKKRNNKKLANLPDPEDGLYFTSTMPKTKI